MQQLDHSPSAERNKHPILQALQSLLPAQGHALEIASGTGQHVTWFAQHLPQWVWQPTEVHPGALHNIATRLAQTDPNNVRDPVLLDVCQTPWFSAPQDAPAGLAQTVFLPPALTPASFDLVLCINMLHIAPWAACAGLMQGAAQYLRDGGVLVTYGPYFEAGTPASDSNIAFDQSLRTHDPSFGIRQLHDVVHTAALAGMQLQARHAMPANNLLLVWGKAK